MLPANRIPIWLRILLPCILVALLGFQPGAQVVRRAFEQARQAQSRQDQAGAAARLREVLSFEPWRVELWETIGLDELAAGKYAQAVSAFQTAEHSQHLSAAGRLAWGDAFLKLGDEQQAAAQWRLVGSQAAFERIYKLAQSRDDSYAILQALKEWGQHYPLDPVQRYRQGLLMLVYELEQALPVLSDAAGKDSNLKGKVETLKKALELAYGSPVEAYQRVVVGRALGSLGEWALAKLEFDQAVSRAPEYAEGWAFLGEARQHLDQDGYPELQRANQIYPRSMIVQALLSIYWRRQGNNHKALEILDSMIAQEPGQTIWLIEAGNTQAVAGNLIAALPYFQKAVRIDPSAASWLALAHFCLNNLVEIDTVGYEAARKALELAPGDPQALDAMGEVYYKLNDLTSAERFLQHALEIDASSPAANLHLGQVYLQSNRNTDALAYLQAAIRFDPDGDYGNMARRLLDQFFPQG